MALQDSDWRESETCARACSECGGFIRRSLDEDSLKFFSSDTLCH